MADMSMNKAIHAAVRRDLDRFVAALEAFHAGDRVRAQQLRSAWANFDDELTRHHEGEHRIAWPALASVGVSADLLAQLDTEHAAMADALAQTGSAMDAFAGTATADDAAAALDAFRRLREVTEAHLEHEEAETESVYLDRRDAPEIKAMGRAFSRAQGPAQAGRFFAWLLDGARPQEKAAITSEIPGPVVTVLTGLFGRSYRREVAPVWRNT